MFLKMSCLSFTYLSINIEQLLVPTEEKPTFFSVEMVLCAMLLSAHYSWHFGQKVQFCSHLTLTCDIFFTLQHVSLQLIQAEGISDPVSKYFINLQGAILFADMSHYRSYTHTLHTYST